MNDRALHGIALRMLRDQHVHDWTEKQEWLFTTICSELEYRRRQSLKNRWANVCSCQLCVSPFPESVSSEPIPFDQETAF